MIRTAAPMRAGLRCLILSTSSVTALALAAPGHAQEVDPAEEITPAEDPPSSNLPGDESGLNRTEPGDADSRIVVTGSRIARSGFSAPSPVTVLGQELAQQRGLTNVGDALNTLPSFRATNAPATNAIAGGNIGARFADLRGLGSGRTLVLVDGRRFVPSTLSGQVDLNQIPSSLVARSEVVTGGASAQYGSDAVAGVVNFILDKDFTGLRGQVQYGQSDRNDNESYQASLAGGFGLMDDRIHVIASVEYDRNDGVGDCYTREWCIPSVVVTNSTPGVNGFPGQVIGEAYLSTASAYGLFTGPAPLRGITFTPDGQPTQFNYGQLPGSFYMLGGSSAGGLNTFLEGVQFVVPTKRINAFAHADIEVTDDITLFGEFSWGETKGSSVGAQKRDILGGLTIFPDNAFLPDAVRQIFVQNDIARANFGRLETDIGHALNFSTGETKRFVVGAEGNFSNGWAWDIYYQHGTFRNEARTENNVIIPNFNAAYDAVIDPATGLAVCRSTLPGAAPVPNAQPGCQPLNLFGYNRFGPDVRDYVTGTSLGITDSKQDVVAASVQGDLFQLPAGPVSFALGVEYRRDEASAVADPLSQQSLFYANAGANPGGDIEVKEGFLEAVMPVLADMGPFAESLELNGAVRRTNYSTSGMVTTWKVGAVYEPFDFLRLRVTRSRDIRAPNVQELFAPSVYGCCTSITDPRDNSIYFIPTAGGGNTDLQPEKANTFTMGMVFTPQWNWAQGFRFSVDYYDIEIADIITTIGAQTIVTRCEQGAAELCDFVFRDPAGTLLRVRNSSLNLSQLSTKGLDFEADYTLDLADISASLPGSLSLRVLATYVDELVSEDTSGAVDRAGMTGWPIQATPGVPHWTGDLTATYETGPLSLTLTGHFIDEGVYDVFSVGPEQDGYDPALRLSIDDNSVPSRFYTGINAQYDLIEREDGRNLQLYAGVSNLFDVDPPIAPGQQITNTILFDPVGRAYRFGLRFNY